jgi:hypothetical protein
MTYQPADTPQLTEAYYKAHKSYAFFSAVLIAWELVGIELTAKPLENLNITLKTPSAAPIVFIALVIYFGFRLWVEWLQCDMRRRLLAASRLDFAVAHGLGGLALCIYFVQRLLEIRIAALFLSDRGSAVLGGVLLTMVIVPAILRWRRQDRVSRYVLILLLVSVPPVMAYVHGDTLVLTIACYCGYVVGYVILLLGLRVIRTGLKRYTKEGA